MLVPAAGVAEHDLAFSGDDSGETPRQLATKD